MALEADECLPKVISKMALNVSDQCSSGLLVPWGRIYNQVELIGPVNNWDLAVSQFRALPVSSFPKRATAVQAVNSVHTRMS